MDLTQCQSPCRCGLTPRMVELPFTCHGQPYRAECECGIVGGTRFSAGSAWRAWNLAHGKIEHRTCGCGGCPQTRTEGGRVRVMCWDCGYSTGLHATEAEAWRAWE